MSQMRNRWFTFRPVQFLQVADGYTPPRVSEVRGIYGGSNPLRHRRLTVRYNHLSWGLPHDRARVALRRDWSRMAILYPFPRGRMRFSHQERRQDCCNRGKDAGLTQSTG